VNILFITSTRIGDAVLSTGLLGALSDRRDARITLACGPAAAALFEEAPGVERVIALAKQPRAGHWRALWRACAGRRWDLLVDLRHSVLSYLLRAPEKRVLRSRPDGRHQVERLAEVLGLEPPPAPRLWIGERHRAEARARLGDGGALLALGPAANWRGKEWPPERFVELARHLTGPGVLAGARVVLLGAAAEREAGRPLVEGLAGRVIDLIGEVGLLTAAAVIEQCNLYVGNDSGLMHIAAATGVPTLGLFGPSRDEHYAPWGEATAVVRTPESYDELIARPGYDHRTTASLMGSLAVEAVEAAAVALLTEAS
jgi:ADP-heptose:LPS heptosyltransferase